MSKIAVYHPSSILSPEKIGKYKKNRTFVSISNTNKHNENINTIKNNGL